MATTFYTGNFHLTVAQCYENAKIFWAMCHGYHPNWSNEALAALVGNGRRESGCNPGIWQGLSPGPKSGYGFFQWTPGNDYIQWCNSSGYNPTQMLPVLKRVEYELEHGIQYYQTKAYPISFEDFFVSRKSPSWLAQAWAYNYERPSVLPDPLRSKYAMEFYKEFTGESGEPNPDIPDVPNPPDVPVETANKFWWIYYMKR